jgi:hypothetical protein
MAPLTAPPGAAHRPHPDVIMGSLRSGQQHTHDHAGMTPPAGRPGTATRAHEVAIRLVSGIC